MIIMLGVFKALMEYNDLRSHHSILRTTKKLNELKPNTCFWSHQGAPQPLTAERGRQVLGRSGLRQAPVLEAVSGASCSLFDTKG